MFSEKTQEGVSKVKARIVVRDLKDTERNFVRKDSPRCGRENLRLVLALITLKTWKIHSMDIKSAFLKGQPKEACTNEVWKLNTTIYGLCDAPKAWYLNVKEELINTGGVKSRYDDAIFFWHNNQLLQGILSSHMDDFFWSETE